VEDDRPDPVGQGRGRRVLIRRVLITGAGGQLGRALQERFADGDVLALTREQWDVAHPPSVNLTQGGFALVLHAAAWTDVDGAEADPQGASAVNVGGTANVAGLCSSLGAQLVAYSTDYVFDGRKGEPYVESDAPNPLSAYGRSKLLGEAAAGPDAWVVRTSWLFGATGHNFVRTMLRLAEERDEVAVVDDQRGCPTFVGHLAQATRQLVESDAERGVWHLAADGDCTWAELAEAVFEEAAAGCRVNRISTEELGRPAPRPAYGVLRSERDGAPVLPHWRDGLRECLATLRSSHS
jgi:dTDP-4-dehydrorhamnose reductase